LRSISHIRRPPWGSRSAVSRAPTPAAEESPLTIEVRRTGLVIGRGTATVTDACAVPTTAGAWRCSLPATGGAYPWDALDHLLIGDRAANPDDSGVVLLGDDGVSYDQIVHALDLSRRAGYATTAIGGTSSH
jgi:hypothetical protein